MTPTGEKVRRRLVSLKQACTYGGFGKSWAYVLIGEGKIVAYKMGRETLIDLTSIDEYHGTLPRLETRPYHNK